MVYLEHFLNIASALQGTGSRPTSMWDSEDGFLYHILCFPDGRHQHLKVRSFVLLIPFFSMDFLRKKHCSSSPISTGIFNSILSISQTCRQMHHEVFTSRKKKDSSLYLPQADGMLLQKVWDPNESLSNMGSLSV